MNNNLKGMLVTLLAAASFGAISPLAKYVYSFGVTSDMVLVLRFLIASIFIWLYIFLNKKNIDYKINKTQMLIMMLIGALIYFATTTFYFNAIRFIPISIHVMLFCTYPFIVNIFSFYVLHENINKIQVLSMFVAFIGLLLTLSIDSTQLNIIGIVLSLLSAFSNAGYILLLGLKKIQNINPIVTAGYTNLFSTISFCIYSSFKHTLNFNMPINAWFGIMFIALISTAIAIIALSTGIRMIGASKASIICTFEPLESIILSCIVLGETLTTKQLLGVTLIISSIIMINLFSEENKQKIHINKIHIRKI